jgi:xylose dehydrogenase (NAD/NADP)
MAVPVPALRWGILGAARINRSLIPPFRAAGGPQTIEGIASRSEEKARAASVDWQIPKVFGSYEALLADPNIDAVYVPLPNYLHAEWTVRAAAAGKHVLCEKPLAISVAEVDRVREAAARARVHVAEAFMYRHHAQTDFVAQLVKDGAVGALRLLRGCFSFPLTRPGDVRFDPGMGGGSAWDVGCYPVSYTRLLMGANPTEVRSASVVGPTGIDLTLAGVLRFPGDVLATVDSSFIEPFRTEMEIVGETGIIRVARPFKPGMRETIAIVRGDHVEERTVEGQPLYVDEIEDFARVVGGAAKPKVTLEDSRGNVATLVALLESAASGRAVALGG